ncbi:MAG: NADP-dependent malic enzyme [Rhodospirillales bacterium]|nr:NADP-dependent malic enzyme [Rhodospirillales bacterium]MBO6787569.1 NADP-dependent malic enzyme [Rhodospirillales bacterium]
MRMHASGKPGKIEIHPTKQLTTQRDLTLAYSPGVAGPCLAIHEDQSRVYELTARGNMVAVISNGTAVLGLGNIGPLAAKPVMEGKCVLFKRFADVDAFNVEVFSENVDEVVESIRLFGNAFGGINLEDIKAPECFMIEERLKELLDVPVFHDDQHGTAIITAAGLINAVALTGRTLADSKIVINGAGAASIACADLMKAMGVNGENIIMCDSKGVIYRGREDGMNQWKSAQAVDTDARTLADAMKGADVFIGLSVKDAVSPDMVKAMADKPIIFAMANPDPEITPEDVKAVRDDAIIATGRSDYPNQINNVLGFPYIFRGALDVRARRINEEMKIAAAHALADLAREDVPDEVDAAYAGIHLQYGPDYLIPTPFDPRLIVAVPKAVAQAAMDSGVAQKPIEDMEAYESELSARLNPIIGNLQATLDQVRAKPRRVVFAEGEEEKSIRAAHAFLNAGYGTPVLVGREERVRETMKTLGLGNIEGLEIHNARLSDRNADYAEYLYTRLQRKGHLKRDCQRLVNQDRNFFAACMVATGDADAMVTGLTRNYHSAMNNIASVIEPAAGARVMGLSMIIDRGRTLFVADTVVAEAPDPRALADIARQSAAEARRFGHEPRVALISFANFGHPALPRAEMVREAVQILDKEGADFEYDGEMAVDVALNKDLLANYPFCRLSDTANVLVMPGLHSAQISMKLLASVSGATVLGPLIKGLSKPIQVVPMGSTVADMVTLAALTAHEACD